MKIMQAWVEDLSLSHQGVLVAAVRGCDGALRDDPSKWLVRYYRACILECHQGDVTKCVEGNFMHWPRYDGQVCYERVQFLRSGLDHYPMHWLTHFMFAAEIVGYYHPDKIVKAEWNRIYQAIVCALHLNIETKEELDIRLHSNAKK